jgi:uncharacterized protein YjbI with pentapeptide repeats
MQRLRRFIIQSKKRTLWIVLALVTLLVVWSILLPLAQTGSAPEWTGFGPIISLPRYPHISVIGLVQPAKTLWDWLQLLAALLIPVVVAYAGLSFTRQQSQTERKIADDRLLEERRIADDRQRDATLETYFGRVSQLVLDEGTRGLKHEPDVQAVARAWTVTTLRRLDAERNAFLLRFLRESHLMDLHDAPIDLSEADLSRTHLRKADLSGAYLRGANLSGANLREADLSGADLAGADLGQADLIEAQLTRARLVEAHLASANLRGAYLREADLSEANLREATLHGATLISADLSGANLREANLVEASLIGANLCGAYLRGADLRGAELRGADLTEADLSRARVSDEQLAEAASYHGATTHDRSQHDDGTPADVGHL